MQKNKKYKRPLLVFIVVLLLGTAHFARALEIKYPNLSILGLPPLDSGSSIADYVSYFFGLGIYMAGVLALISFSIGAVSLIASADSTEVASNAKDRMKGAALGLVLTFAAFIILRTINPTLVTPTIAPIAGGGGAYYTNGTDQKPSPMANPDTSTIPTGFNNIKYVCAGNSNPALLVWMFPNTGLEGGAGNITGARLQRVSCGNQIPIAGRSFKMSFETPGIYYYTTANCNGYGSGPFTSNQDTIVRPFNRNIRSIKIVDDWPNETAYGAIFHAVVGLSNAGACSDPIVNEGCSAVSPSYASAIDIFALNTPTDAGDGVNFYSEPRGWLSESEAGFYNVKATDMQASMIQSGTPFVKLKASDMKFKYDEGDLHIDRWAAYKALCNTFQNCPDSIKINGSYLVVLYNSNVLGLTYCQTFNADVLNLKTEQIVASVSSSAYIRRATLPGVIGGAGGGLGNVFIIPTQ